MNQLQREAIEITKELGDVVFVGALAVHAHLRWRHRSTSDVDIAMTVQLTRDELEKRGYRTYNEGGKEVIRTPRGYKIDIYTNDVSGIPVDTVYDTAIEVSIGKSKIKVACKEVMLIAKLRAMRPQDKEDFITLCTTYGESLDWDILEAIGTEMEVLTIKQSVRALS